MGEVKSWHFQHQADDQNCNPQPMTLLHAFVRDALAERKSLHIPARGYRVSMSFGAGFVDISFQIDGKTLEVIQAETELRENDVQPDVTYTVEGERRYAVEVKYTHAVDELKLQKLRAVYAGSLEFDVSDLPPEGVTYRELEQYLQDARRWLWLHGAELMHAQARAEEKYRWMNSQWSIPRDFSPYPRIASKANSKLKLVERQMSWAASKYSALKANKMPNADATKWLGAQNKIDRVAIACVALKISPVNFPDFFQMGRTGALELRRALSHHPYSWQVLVFMKYGIGDKSFHARDVASWCLLAMPDRCEHEDGALSLNGFTKTAACIHLYLLSLMTQGLLFEHPDSSREETRFMPKFKRVDDFKRFIDEKPPEELSGLDGRVGRVDGFGKLTVEQFRKVFPRLE